MTFRKLTAVFCMATLAVLGSCATVAVAVAAGATDLPSPPGIPAPPTTESVRDRAAQAAEDRARAEGRSRVEAARSTTWQRAVDEAKQPDFGKLLAPRPLALVVGLAWLLLATRHKWRTRRRHHTA
ncbi:MAG: hypothetical protein JWN72_2063 [Thermoleophilia bacterium]|nr:hypothetical protein [Thermoleophilia bacterium]